ncbi:MAG: hypothetical protein P1V20_32610 [Verrucomicrobiales bacterium]|nr:hypothetical protein [Verrucomicrobiales bacterium]
MAEINLSDNRGRDAVVNAESVTIPHEYRWIDSQQHQVGTRKILRSTAGNDIETLIREHGDLDTVAEALINGDPEVDIETYGRFLSETSRAYTNPDGDIVHHLSRWEVVYSPEGEEIKRKPLDVEEPNVAGEVPLAWTGKKMKKVDAIRKFVFSGKMQIQHINGLTYDFLYQMAKELSESESFMVLGGGAKGTKPLVFRRGGLSYRGFLEGRIETNRYALILHLSNMELRRPEDDNA